MTFKMFCDTVDRKSRNGKREEKNLAPNRIGLLLNVRKGYKIGSKVEKPRVGKRTVSQR
jgi:hypothetical protein